MPKRLSESQVDAFRRDGILFPLPALAADEAAEARRRYDALTAEEGGLLSKRTNQKPYLLVPWLNDMIRHPAILDQVEDLLGPDLLCWAGGFFHKKAASPGFISWHQDSTYWGLSTPDVVTAWVAFSPSTPEAGCMRVVPGTHLIDQMAHRDTFAPDNMLSRGQEIAVDVDPNTAVDVVLAPGEMSIHHVRIVHGSEPNRADHPRIGFAIRYIPTHLRQLSDIRDSATLVRGQDKFGHFDLEPRPVSDFHPDAVAFHARMLQNTTDILYAGAAQRRQFEPVRPTA
jgi:non-heme Fe2+,alpha-ketoglutarate-dependent halogenase